MNRIMVNFDHCALPLSLFCVPRQLSESLFMVYNVYLSWLKCNCSIVKASTGTIFLALYLISGLGHYSEIIDA